MAIHLLHKKQSTIHTDRGNVSAHGGMHQAEKVTTDPDKATCAACKAARRIGTG